MVLHKDWRNLSECQILIHKHSSLNPLSSMSGAATPIPLLSPNQQNRLGRTLDLKHDGETGILQMTFPEEAKEGVKIRTEVGGTEIDPGRTEART